MKLASGSLLGALAIVLFIVFLYLGHEPAVENNFAPLYIEPKFWDGSVPVWYGMGVNEPEGVLLLLHGCKGFVYVEATVEEESTGNHRAQDWFYLPEEMEIVEEAAKRGLLTMAISSKSAEINGENGGCWTVPENVVEFASTEACEQLEVEDVFAVDAYEDVQRLYAGVRAFLEFKELCSVPIYVFGASSGGMLASFLQQSHLFPWKGGVISLHFPHVPLTSFEKTAIVNMPIDVAKVYHPKDENDLLENGNVLLHWVFPKPVMSELLTSKLGRKPWWRNEREYLMNEHVASKIVQAFQDAELLDEQGWVLQWPTHGRDPFQAALCAHEDEQVSWWGRCSKALVHPRLRQVLAEAYAHHEQTADGMDIIMDWILD